MSLTQEQVVELKNQLKEQVGNLPSDKKNEAISQIDSMSPETIESMLEQQKSQSSSSGQKTIFRMIINGDVDSIKIGENQDSLAVLSITPISKGHVLIIPKKPVSDPKEIPKSSFKLAEELSKKITENLKAKETRAETEIQFGEAILNIIPIYDKPLTTKSQKGKSSLEELTEIKKKLETIKLKIEPEKIKIEKKKTEPEKVLKLNRRIP